MCRSARRARAEAAELSGETRRKTTSSAADATSTAASCASCPTARRGGTKPPAPTEARVSSPRSTTLLRTSTMSPDVSGVPGSKTRLPFVSRAQRTARSRCRATTSAAAATGRRPVDLDAVETVVAAGVAGEVGQRARIGRRRRRRDVDRELAARDRDVLERGPAAASADGFPVTAASFTWPSSSVRAHVSVEPSASSRMPGSSTAVMWRSHVSR